MGDVVGAEAEAEHTEPAFNRVLLQGLGELSCIGRVMAA